MNDDAKRESVAGASRFKAVKISVVVSPPRDGGVPEDAVKRVNLLRRLSLRSRGRGSEADGPREQERTIYILGTSPNLSRNLFGV